MLWLCSPNNPTGNSIAQEILVALCQAFQGLVVVDEAYADFSSQESAVGLLTRFEHLVVLQTLSKAWGMAGIRLGIAMGDPELIALLHKIKPPYNVNSLTQAAAGAALDHEALMVQQVTILRQERDKLAAALQCLENVIKVWPSEANFLLIRFEDAEAVFQYLLARGIVVRNRSRVPMLEQCLRITVGTPEENSILLAALEEISRGGTE
jgi:histidinol-phosphate aminotransferase